MTRNAIRFFRTLFGWRIRVEGLEHVPMESAIIAGNHQSYLDPVQLWIAAGPRVPKGILGITNPSVARGFARTFGAWILPFLGMLPIDPASPGSSVAGAAKAIMEGYSIGIFPEGTRNRGDQSRLHPGKTGIARIALLTGAPIVPAGIVAPPGLTTGQALRGFFSRVPAIVRFGEPLRYPKTPQSQWTPEQLDRIVAEVMQAIARLSGRAYTPRVPRSDHA